MIEVYEIHLTYLPCTPWNLWMAFRLEDKNEVEQTQQFYAQMMGWA